jgi:hypothetical protein
MATEQIHEIAVLRRNDGTGISSTEDLRIGRVN